VKPQELKFMESHEWVALQEQDGQSIATVGISAYAVQQLGDIVHMELPKVGDSVTAGEEFGEIESVKAVSSLYSPVSGQVVEVHTDLPDNLGILNDDPYGPGWIMKVAVSQCSDALLDHDAYQKQCEAN